MATVDDLRERLEGLAAQADATPGDAQSALADARASIAAGGRTRRWPIVAAAAGIVLVAIVAAILASRQPDMTLITDERVPTPSERDAPDAPVDGGDALECREPQDVDQIVTDVDLDGDDSPDLVTLDHEGVLLACLSDGSERSLAAWPEATLMQSGATQSLVGADLGGVDGVIVSIAPGPDEEFHVQNYFIRLQDDELLPVGSSQNIVAGLPDVRGLVHVATGEDFQSGDDADQGTPGSFGVFGCRSSSLPENDFDVMILFSYPSGGFFAEVRTVGADGRVSLLDVRGDELVPDLPEESARADLDQVLEDAGFTPGCRPVGSAGWSGGLVDEIETGSLRPLSSLVPGDVVVPTGPRGWRVLDSIVSGPEGSVAIDWSLDVTEAAAGGPFGHELYVSLTSTPECPFSVGCRSTGESIPIGGLIWEGFVPDVSDAELRETDDIVLRARVGEQWVSLMSGVTQALNGGLTEDPEVRAFVEGLRAGPPDVVTAVGEACWACDGPDGDPLDPMASADFDSPAPIDPDAVVDVPTRLGTRDEERSIRPLSDLEVGDVVLPTYIPPGLRFGSGEPDVLRYRGGKVGRSTSSG